MLLFWEIGLGLIYTFLCLLFFYGSDFFNWLGSLDCMQIKSVGSIYSTAKLTSVKDILRPANSNPYAELDAFREKKKVKVPVGTINMMQFTNTMQNIFLYSTPNEVREIVYSSNNVIITKEK